MRTQQCEQDAWRTRTVTEEEFTEILENRLEELEEKVEETSAFDRLDLNDAKARRDEVEKLVQKVKNHD
jgi:tetrahydromethanopterin S-methyltransferase subunit G